MSPNARSVAVLGAAGQLGSDLVDELRERGLPVQAFGSAELDVTDATALAREIAPGRFAAVVNAAALTNVDHCELHGEEALAANATGAYLAARACSLAGSRYLLVSTDFVFNGEKGAPYVETDLPDPVNIYGASKLAGEKLAMLAHRDTLVLRISSVFGKRGSRGKGGNFVESVLSQARKGGELRVVDDLVMSPTYTRDVARALPGLLDSGATGVLHLANEGSCTWYDFAVAALELAGLDTPVERVTSAEFPRPARRPRNSALATGRSDEEELGRIAMPHWRTALREYLAEKGHLQAAERPSEGAS